jgi:hypothetical protein
MDSFPRLAPTTRVFVFGDLPRSTQVALSGASTRYRQGNRRIDQTLSLTFGHLIEQEMNLIQTHYINSNGTYDIFFLPEEIWGDFVDPPVPLLSDYAWRYASQPSIEDVSFDRFTVSVKLTTYAINFSDLIFDAGGAAASPARTYILDAGAASGTPARDYVINSGASR